MATVEQPRFKRGDVIEYTPQSEPTAHGALAVVTDVKATPYGIDLQWISLTPYLKRFQNEKWFGKNWHADAFTKIGHIDDFPQG